MTNEELEQKVKRLEEQIKDLKVKLEEKVENKPYEVEVPEDIDRYYYVDELGDINLVGDTFHETDYEGLYLRGLAFKTREEAEQFDKERILINKFKDWAKKYNESWTPHENNTVKFYIIYRNSDKTLDVNWCSGIRNFFKLPYFKSKRLAQQFIEAFGDEINEVLC